MDFFQQLKAKMTDCKSARFTVAMKGDEVTVTFYPEMKQEAVNERLLPLTLKGTAEELDGEFFTHVSKQIETAAGVQTNVEQVLDEVKKAQTDAKKEAAKAKGKKDATKDVKPKTETKVILKDEADEEAEEEGPVQQAIEFE
jgi:PRTRC genetic system protein E